MRLRQTCSLPLLLILLLINLTTGPLTAQQTSFPVLSDVPEKEMAYPTLSIDFNDHLHVWDGFGVNYVEATQTRDYDAFAQDHSGFNVLSEEARQEIVALVFGEDGLKPGVTKMFLDVWHEGMSAADNDNDDPWTLNMAGFDHERTTRWMRYFNREGLKMTRARGGDLEIIATLYGPAPWMTRQKVINGRDLNPAMKEELAEYMVSWVKYLREEENLPVQYLSFHNEGDAYYRWPPDGSTPGEDWEDYNMYWPPEQLVEMIKLTRRMLDRNDLQEVGLTPGETQTWYRFDEWGYAGAIEDDPEALHSLALVTSHSFANYDLMGSRFYGDWRSNGIDLLRAKKSNLHAWTTSLSWGRMDAVLMDEMRRNIYVTKCNSVMPWAFMHRPGQWLTDDGGRSQSARGAFRANDEGTYDILPGYFFYKQVTRAGQPGMAVAEVTSLDPAVSMMAFAANGTANPDAFVVINISEEEKNTTIHVQGTDASSFTAYRTSPAGDRYAMLGLFKLNEGIMKYRAPAGSVTTFFAR